jgi:hypothetical protein
MPSTPADIGQPTRGVRTGRKDRGERGNKWWTLVAAIIAFVAGVVSLAAIRSRDFAHPGPF